MKLNYIIYSLILLLTASCGSQKSITPTENVRVETRVERITEIDTAWITLPQQTVERLTKDTISVVENDYASSTAHVHADGTLLHTLAMKSTPVAVGVKHVTEYRDSVVEREIKVPQPYPIEVERQLSKAQKFQIRGFWLLLGTIMVILAIRHRKMLLRLIKKIV